MKKFFIKVLVIGIALLAVWCRNNYKQMENYEPIEENLTIPLGDTGITFELPSEHAFEGKTSENNDFYGQGDSGNWAIIVNHEDKEGFTLEEYAQACAEANNAGEAKIASDGNYYFEYENGEYHNYTAVRQNNQYYYRVSFYCMKEYWSEYESDFADWATTIKLDQK